MSTFFPFHRLGLRRNPFGTLDDDEWFAVTILPEAVETALHEGFDHLLVLGDRGRGKSTTLHYLTRYFARRGEAVAYERIPRWHFAYTTDITSLRIFVLDEAQRLTLCEEWRLFRQAAGKRLIIGSHRDHTYAFRLRQWQVVTVRLHETASRDRLALILERRLAVFTLPEGTPVQFTPDAVDWLWGRFGDDLRTMNDFLYTVFQQLKHAHPITRERLQTHG